MINYSLDLQVGPFQNRINFDDRIALMGSCFTEHIGNRLSAYQFDTFLNPAGIVFNPISLAEPLKRMIRAEKYRKDDLVFFNSKWVSLYHHGNYHGATEEECLQKINTRQEAFEEFLSSARWLVITFGTSWVYEYSALKMIVANCHKIPQAQFTKRLLDVNEIVEEWKSVIEIVQKLNNKLRIIFTVSPVKHLRDGVHENSLSKATLLLAVNKLVSKDVHYFPAYELVNDDLRDYRFYEQDGAHPNTLAIDYVFEKFRQSVLSEGSNEMLEALDKYYRLKNHRPLSNLEMDAGLIKDKLELMKMELVEKNNRLGTLDF